MKYLHLVLGNSLETQHQIGSLIRELNHSSTLLDYTNLVPAIEDNAYFESNQIEQKILAEFSDKYFDKDSLVILLPKTPRYLRLLFSEILEFPCKVKCICWNISSERSDASEPSSHEGYDAFIDIKATQKNDDLSERVKQLLNEIPSKIANSSNRNGLKVRHRYSSFFSFERLMFLIRSFLEDPNLACNNGIIDGPYFDHSPASVRHLARKLIEKYKNENKSEYFSAHVERLNEDLVWLSMSGFVGEHLSCDSFPEIFFPQPDTGRETPLRHPFSGWEEFSRLMVLIRHLIFNPGDFIKGEPLNQYLAERLSRYPGSLWTSSSASSVRHYLRVGVKPYIDDRPARKGHFLGSAVVSLGDLSELVSIVSSSAPLLNSPQTQALVLSLEQRLASLNVAPRNAEALSSLAERSIVNPSSAPPGSVRFRKPDFSELSSAISRRQEIRIQLFASDAQTTTDSSVRKADSVLVLPLQFVFHRRAWYLAAEERQPGRSDGPIRFLRLDRFRLLRVEPSAQKEERFSLAFSRMCRLVDRTFGLPPNKLSYQDQSVVWIADDSWMTADKTLSVSCRLDYRTWKFIREGPDRLPYPQLRMSGGLATHTTVWKPPVSLAHMDQIYCLPVHADSDHPFELQMVLPAWSVDDFDLQNWLLGFGSGLVLIGPDSFRQKLLERLQSTLTAWQSPP